MRRSGSLERETRRLAELLVQAGRQDVALPLLHALADRIERFRLDDWEPQLAAEVYRLQVDANRRLQKKIKDPKDKAAETYATAAREAHALLCRVDPARAIAMQEE